MTNWTENVLSLSFKPFHSTAMNAPKSVTLYLFFIAILTLITSCKQDISREAFAGLKLGSTVKEYRAALTSAKFSKARTGRHYYTFTTNEGKPFYGAVYANYNADSVILSIGIYLTQHKSQAGIVGEDMFTGKTWINTNLVDVKDEVMPAEEEIYKYIKAAYDKKYKVRLADRQDITTQGMYKDFTYYDTDKNMEVVLERFVDTTPPNGDGYTPRGCISIHYYLTNEYIKANKLDKYISREADF